MKMHATFALLFIFFSSTSNAFVRNPACRNCASGKSFATRATTSETPTTVQLEEPSVVEVGLGDRSYPIYIGSGMYSDGRGEEILQRHVTGNKVLVVTNDLLAPIYLDRCVSLLKAGDSKLDVVTVVLRDGEAHKTLDELTKIYDRALETQMDRKCTFIALGGGVIGDMVGYAAASYQRGVNFIQIPTSVMAMVDSSVGGKTGVNHPLGKNMIGAFHQPQCVMIDIDILGTLPDRELCSGFSEVIKYGLIRDTQLFEWLEENMEKLVSRDAAALSHMVEQSCLNKAEIVAADEREAGVRATLNLGHTFGHPIESGLGYGEWLHGEAVAVGTVMATRMSRKLNWIDDDVVKRSLELFKRANLPVGLPEGCKLTSEDFRGYMALDKKVANGVLRLILLRGPVGSCTFTGDYDMDALDATLAEFTGENI
uniref:3-dehydroquinate synthase n=1 Tax=Octactis speculum TaxID=3111310 RepID=A0A7S2FHC5_9STRA|mmetsp:Transcript_22343/g.30514  ORF Transcript_22343/g.30514 Transcript_22343/m.30514 type:complete len:426 (+) Transcript_22343:33-1310(+)